MLFSDNKIRYECKELIKIVNINKNTIVLDIGCALGHHCKVFKDQKDGKWQPQKYLKDPKIKKIYNIFKSNLNVNSKFSVAISGGPDSMALAFLAKCFSIINNIDINFYLYYDYHYSINYYLNS